MAPRDEVIEALRERISRLEQGHVYVTEKAMAGMDQSSGNAGAESRDLPGVPAEGTNTMAVGVMTADDTKPTGKSSTSTELYARAPIRVAESASLDLQEDHINGSTYGYEETETSPPTGAAPASGSLNNM